MVVVIISCITYNCLNAGNISLEKGKLILKEYWKCDNGETACSNCNCTIQLLDTTCTIMLFCNKSLQPQCSASAARIIGSGDLFCRKYIGRHGLRN